MNIDENLYSLICTTISLKNCTHFNAAPVCNRLQ